MYLASSSLTSGKLIDLAMSGNGPASGNPSLLNIALTGANTTNAITTTGATISNTRTNATSGTNVALTLTASGATTVNTALNVTAGASLFPTGVQVYNGVCVPSVGSASYQYNGLYFKSTGVSILSSNIRGIDIDSSGGSGSFQPRIASFAGGAIEICSFTMPSAGTIQGYSPYGGSVAGGAISFLGGNAFGTNSAGGTVTISGGTGTGNVAGGSIVFKTARAGSTGTTAGTLANALTIGTGAVTVDMPLRLTGYTVATLPSTAANGMVTGAMAYVTDATAPTYLGALTGGGAVTCPVFYNGSAWVSH
jgi:hypothetical protein